MRKPSLDRWLNFGASIAVFLGLLLVAYEIQQANQVAFAEMRNEVNTDWLNISTSAYSSDIGQMMSKAIQQPDQLSDEEIFKLGNYLGVIMVALHKQAVLFYEFGWAIDPAIYTRQYAIGVFSSQFGRAWYLENRNFHPKLIELLDREVATLPITNDWHPVENIRERIKNLSEAPATN